MSFDSVEKSLASGNPIEYYEFNTGFNIYRYCSGDEDFTDTTGNVYEKYTISKTDIEEVTEINRSGIKIMVPRDNIIAEQFRVSAPSFVITVKIFKKHRTDAEPAIIWIGRIMSCEWDGGEATLSSEPVYTSIKRNGLRRFYQIQCPHLIYGSACGIAQHDYATTGSLVAISGVVAEVPAAVSMPNGFFSGGFLSIANTATGTTERRLILKHEGQYLTMAATVTEWTFGDTVTLFAGCDHTLQTCETKFSNEDNYGGYPAIPGLNPFALTTIF